MSVQALTTPEPERYVTRAELADLMGVSVTTIDRMVRMTAGPPTNPPTEAPMSSSSGDHHLSPRSTPHSRPDDAGRTARRHVASFLAAIRGETPAPAESSPAAGPPTDRPRSVRRGRSAAAAPVPPDGENPYRAICEQKAAMGRADFAHYARDADVWDEGFAAGRAAASPDPPDEEATDG